MILIGQYDSPFVRRVAIALTLYELPFTQQPWSTFADADKLRVINPLGRVPTLVLADGTALLESGAIVDYIDSLVPPGRAMFPRDEPARHQALRVAALATGLADKAVSLFYERALHSAVSDTWVERCTAQITLVLAALERERAQISLPWWRGSTLGHEDVAVACALRFLDEAHGQRFSLTDYPALVRHCAQAEALDVFKQVYQRFNPPA